jgi:hypothetical protein
MCLKIELSQNVRTYVLESYLASVWLLCRYVSSLANLFGLILSSPGAFHGNEDNVMYK